MIITPELEYPMVCVSIKQAYQPNKFKLDLINLNSGKFSGWLDCSVVGFAGFSGGSVKVLGVCYATKAMPNCTLEAPKWCGYLNNPFCMYRMCVCVCLVLN